MSKKAQAAAIPNVPTSAGGNMANRQDQMYREIDELAKTEGSGANSRAHLGVKCVEWSAGGIADVGDAKPIYERYIGQVQDVASAFGGLKIQNNPDSGLKQNVSKIRQFLKMGGLKTIDPVAVINTAAAVVKDARLKGKIGYGPFDALLNIARAQCGQTQTALTDEEMIAVNQPKDRPDLLEADDLGKIAAAITAHVDKFGEATETTEALTQIEAKIEQLGGTTAQKKEKERQQKLADKKKVKRK